jgi:hypothetical protein
MMIQPNLAPAYHQAWEVGYRRTHGITRGLAPASARSLRATQTTDNNTISASDHADPSDAPTTNVDIATLLGPD